jgi:hypothetical protein
LYYPNTSILEAVPKDGMSYTWRSILRGVELLKQGIIWRIGTGEEVDAFDDPWIPRGSTRRPRTHNILNEKMRVCDLIDQTTVTWDEELIKSLFDEEDAKEILSIPLRPKMEDWVAWHYDKKGEFSVKSAYRLGVSIRDAQLIADASSSISTEPKNKVWSKLWNLKLPGKVKIFSWRLCQNSPPTRMNIKRKRVELDTRCPMCYRMDEDGGHLFLKCKCVKHIWRSLLLEDVRQFLLSAPNATAMFESIWTLPSNMQSMVLVLFWDWWTTRNKKSAEGKERTVEETCHMIQRHWVDFQIKPGGESKGTISNITTAKLEDRWSKPQENWVKVNFDAAFRAESRIGAWGYIARSDDGDCIGAAAGKLRYIRDPLQAEAEAGLAAVEGAAAMGLNRVVFESDSKNLVSALRDKKQDLSVIGVLLKEMRSICIVSFQSFKFQFVSRKINGVAHSLA